MARPSSFDRDKAVETAMQEIWRAGYEASSVKAIAEKLGITRSSYYNAFGSREGLFREALAAYFAQSPDRVLHGDLPDTSIRVLLTETFRAICAARAADPEGRGCMAINCLCELVGSAHGEAGALVAEAVLASAARLEELLSIAVARGELADDTDVAATALAVQALLVGINALSKAVRSEEALWRATRTALDGLGLYEESSAGPR